MTVNKNTIPYDVNTPMVTSGIRLGTPALTTRGMEEAEMKTIGTYICEVLDAIGEEGKQAEVRAKIADLTRRFPLYQSRVSQDFVNGDRSSDIRKNGKTLPPYAKADLFQDILTKDWKEANRIPFSVYITD